MSLALFHIIPSIHLRFELKPHKWFENNGIRFLFDTSNATDYFDVRKTITTQYRYNHISMRYQQPNLVYFYLWTIDLFTLRNLKTIKSKHTIQTKLIHGEKTVGTAIIYRNLCEPLYFSFWAIKQSDDFYISFDYFHFDFKQYSYYYSWQYGLYQLNTQKKTAL